MHTPVIYSAIFQVGIAEYFITQEYLSVTNGE